MQQYSANFKQDYQLNNDADYLIIQLLDAKNNDIS